MRFDNPAHSSYRAMKFFRRTPRCRTAVCPPSSSFGADSRWRQLTRWLRPDGEGASEGARQAFEEALRGLPGDEAEKLRTRVRRSPGLQELWHLRSAVFGLVARHSSQLEAQRRMATLDRHFPSRRLNAAAARRP